MNDSFYEQQPQHRDERFVEPSSFKKEKRKKKRSSSKKEKHTAVKNSLEQFLVDSQLEDMHFTQQQQQQQQQQSLNNIVTPKRRNADAPSLASSVDLFDRNALAAAGKSSKRQHKHKKKKSTRKQQPKEQRQDQLHESSKVFETSLAKIFDDNDVADDQSEGSLSLSDLKMEEEEPTREEPRRRRSSRQSRASKRPSYGSYGQLGIGVRPRSSMGRRGSNSINGINNNDLMSGLNRLDKQVRRDRMKREYRAPSQNSFSTMSTKSSYTSQPYKRTGFEGGALNAILGNESFARMIASKKGDTGSLSGSGTFGSSLSDDKFLKERKARQDHILDMVTGRKPLPLPSKKKEDLENFLKPQPLNPTTPDLDSTYASTSYASEATEGTERKKGLVKKMKKAVRKSAKMSKSGAKVVANTVVESSKQRSSRKGYKPAPELSQREREHPLRREDKVKTPTHSNKTKVRTNTATSSKSKKGRGVTKPESFRSLESSSSKKGKGSSLKSFTSFTSFESMSPLFQRPTKGRAVVTASTKIKPKITRGLNDSMSEMFPEFQLAENSKVVWWDI